MNVDLTAQEIQVAINALRSFRAQQLAIGACLQGLISEEQVRNGMKLVTDLEAKLVSTKNKEIRKQENENA